MSLATPSPSAGAPTLAPPSVALCSAGIHVDGVRPVGAALAPSLVAMAARASAAGNAGKQGSKAGRSPASCNKPTQSQIAPVKLRRTPMKHTTSFCPTDMKFPYVKNRMDFVRFPKCHAGTLRKSGSQCGLVLFLMCHCFALRTLQKLRLIFPTLRISTCSHFIR
jgi:hypothetical protein